jgi:hypothetical protein
MQKGINKGVGGMKELCNKAIKNSDVQAKKVGYKDLLLPIIG